MLLRNPFGISIVLETIFDLRIRPVRSVFIVIVILFLTRYSPKRDPFGRVYDFRALFVFERPLLGRINADPSPEVACEGIAFGSENRTSDRRCGYTAGRHRDTRAPLSWVRLGQISYYNGRAMKNST